MKQLDVDRFTEITESRILRMPSIELQMLFDRYTFVRERSSGHIVLEVGCGQGLGAPLISANAKMLIVADLLMSNLTCVEEPNHHFITCCDASQISLRDDCVDVVAGLEMVYYVPSLDDFLKECRRVLRPKGVLLLTLPNCNRPGFHRSPYSTHYPSVLQMRQAVIASGFSCSIFGVFKLEQTWTARLFRFMSGFAEKMRLVPKSLSARARLKRFLQGPLEEYPGVNELERRFGQAIAKRDLLSGESIEHLMLYVVATKDESA